ncbi:hypothetical protein [Caballeronia grimmiae]|uniref:hypothetical protein n=1 Tax=Caballeronia grimmiae TaxID=1071679 RepID=UPI001362AD91|nr:hypothetical protein [Caballeronia grimmiae]
MMDAAGGITVPLDEAAFATAEGSAASVPAASPPPPQAANVAVPAPAIMKVRNFLREKGALVVLVTLEKEVSSCVWGKLFNDTAIFYVW